MSAWPINLVLSAQVKSWLDSSSWITDQASGERRSNRSLDAAFADGVTNNYANELSSIGPDWLDYPVDRLHRSCAGTKSICILFRSPLEEHASLRRPGLVLHNLNNYATCWLPFLVSSLEILWHGIWHNYVGQKLFIDTQSNKEICIILRCSSGRKKRPLEFQHQHSQATKPTAPIRLPAHLCLLLPLLLPWRSSQQLLIIVPEGESALNWQRGKL